MLSVYFERNISHLGSNCYAEYININVHDKTLVFCISFFLRQATDQYSGRGSPVIKKHLKIQDLCMYAWQADVAIVDMFPQEQNRVCVSNLSQSVAKLKSLIGMTSSS